jgi:hypothetical protein
LETLLGLVHVLQRVDDPAAIRYLTSGELKLCRSSERIGRQASALRDLLCRREDDASHVCPAFFQQFSPFEGIQTAGHQTYCGVSLQSRRESEQRRGDHDRLSFRVGDNVEAAGCILQQLKGMMYFADFRSAESMGKNFARPAALALDRDHA